MVIRRGQRDLNEKDTGSDADEIVEQLQKWATNLRHFGTARTTFNAD